MLKKIKVASFILTGVGIGLLLILLERYNQTVATVGIALLVVSGVGHLIVLLANTWKFIKYTFFLGGP